MNTFSRAEYLDVLALAEPLACVLHAQKKLPASFIARSVTIFGGGPIGALHALQARQRFPFARIQVVEPNDARRQVLARQLPFVSVFHTHETIADTDLTIVTTSHPQAAPAAIEATSNAGIVILFSGINRKHNAEPPLYEGHDLEAIHRNEEIRIAPRQIRLVGSYGYHPDEISEAAQQLVASPGTYKVVQTGIFDAFDGRDIDNKHIDDSGIIKMLTDESVYAQHLKIVYRLDRDESANYRVVLGQGAGRVDLSVFKLGAEVPDGMVRVRMRRVSICETDRRVIQGLKSSRGAGLTLGHEGHGVVKAIGATAPRSLLDASCVVLPHYFEGQDELASKGMGYLSHKMQLLGVHINGLFATYADVPWSCVHVIDDLLPSCVFKNSSSIGESV